MCAVSPKDYDKKVRGTFQCEEIASGFRHLLIVQEKVSVGSNATRPMLARKDCGVVVEEEGQVVLDQIFARNTEVHRVPSRVIGFVLYTSHSILLGTHQ